MNSAEFLSSTKKCKTETIKTFLYKTEIRIKFNETKYDMSELVKS